MRKYIAELLGTYTIVFAGTGAIIINEETGGGVTHAGVAITFGLIVMSMIYGLGQVSGAHFNPAVSIAFTIAKRFDMKLLPGYIVSQLSGAALASLTLRLLFPGNASLGATMPLHGTVQSFVLEFILTFILMLVIVSVAAGSKERDMIAGLAIGAVVALEAMFAGPVCGASMNPARSFGPALVSGHTEHLWIYIVAPVAGAMVAMPISKYINKTI